MADEETTEVRRTEFGVLKRETYEALDRESLVDAWKEIGVVEANSGDQAKRIAAEANGPGEYVAVAARWWKPEIFEPETVTRLVSRPAGQTSIVEEIEALDEGPIEDE